MSNFNEATRAKPQGYICIQYVEKTGFQLNDVLSDLETIVNANLPRDEVYRLIGRAIGKIHRANESNSVVREICSRK